MTMTPERFRQIRDVAEAALDRPEHERPAFLSAACAENDTLRAEVDSLLEAYEEMRRQSFLETPAAELRGREPLTAGEEDPHDEALPPGTRVGAYELGDTVGRGGMGIVYRAVRADDEYRHVVAVKVIRRGMDTAVGQRRFREERQILAGLDHPGIARLLDGGTTEAGLPYFVMEYVEGEPIDAYCDRRRLDVAERLRLFLRVCAPVHHAHRSLVVHRDLKPGNILVTADGSPKLLDFGIARLVRPAHEPGDVDLTVTVLRMLTPDYASPEQVRGEPVTTATDVYSLGVLLYELLSGQRPYRTGHIHEVMAAICDVDPKPPSASVARNGKPTTAEAPALLRRTLAGDLDTIVLKALRKAPNERYASVEAFADDVTRHLEGRPVRARPHTVAYRASKFVRRHRAAVVGASLAILALVGTTLVALVQAREARAARTRAEKRFQDVRRLANSVIFELHDGIRQLPGSTSVRELLVKRALEYLDDLGSENPEDPRLKSELAAAYEKIGDVQGGITFQNLGHRDEALASYRRALALRQELAKRFPDDSDHQDGLASIHNRLGMLSAWDSDLAGAVASYSLELQAARNMLRLKPGDAKGRRGVATALANLGQARCAAGDVEQGLADSREAIRLFEDMQREDPPEPRTVVYDFGDTLATLRLMLGESLLAATDRASEALEAFRPAVAFREEQLRTTPNNAEGKAKLAFLIGTVGDAQQRVGALADAARSYERARMLSEELLAIDPKDEETRFMLLSLQVSAGEVDVKAGRIEAGEARLRSALARLKLQRGLSPGDNRLLKVEAFGERALGLAFDARGPQGRKHGEACAHHLRSLQAWLEALGERPLTKTDADLASRMRAAADRCRSSAQP
jgi:non-specific serine/threonine protein kinase/serine/threonine-protein kinase